MSVESLHVTHVLSVNCNLCVGSQVICHRGHREHREKAVSLAVSAKVFLDAGICVNLLPSSAGAGLPAPIVKLTARGYNFHSEK
jgi:hypothetical protein